MTTQVRDRRMLIGGEWVDSRTEKWIDVENPGSKTIFARVPRGNAADVDAAVDAAATAFTAWSVTSPDERAAALHAIANELDERVEELAAEISRENGNAIRTQSRPEAVRTAQLFRYLAGLCHEIKGVAEYVNAATLDYTRREPYGVVGAIVPWNSPVSLAAQKIAPAVAFGNTVVLKASEVAPLGVLTLGEICNRALPPGVVNIVTGYGDECGAPLVAHPRVPKLTFTGSTAVGREILAASAAKVASVSLELGGKSAQIVYPDVDIDTVADGIVSAMRFTRQGQSCTAGSRLFAHATIADELVEAVGERLTKLRVGDPLDEATDMGAIVSRRQFDRVCGFVDEATQASPASLVLGGHTAQDGPLSEGYFYEPTVFLNLPDEVRLNREEVFGPVLTVHTWTEEADVIARANDSAYGLAGYVWCRDGAVALRTAHALQAGWVMVNQGGGQALGHSYGGMKQSGLGRELSLEGMLEGFTQIKQISARLR
jgi:betaine-aldehyde dehydrogenase